MVETPSRPLHLFISHEEKEKQIAVALKKLVESIFGDRIDVFVSSDDSSIPLGKQWFDVITAALGEADYFFVLCSETAVTRPWINFELGGACLLNKTIIPLCIHGMQFDQLPQPYSNFQGLLASDYARLSTLFKEIAARISCPLPPVDMVSTDYHRAIHNISPGRGDVSVTIRGAGTYYVGEKVIFSGTATDGSEIVKLNIYNAADPYSLLEEGKAAVQKDQTYEQGVNTSRLQPGDWYVRAESQTGKYSTCGFRLLPMRDEPTPTLSKLSEMRKQWQ